MYEPYLTVAEYIAAGGSIPQEEAESYLRSASRQIDSLTHNRIVAVGFAALTPFQQEIIKEVCFSMAEFAYENADLLSSALSSYSINGVSMLFGSGMNVVTVGGVVIRRDTYDLLLQTGLCYAGVR